MAKSPEFKLYNDGGEYVGSCRDTHYAAQFVAAMGPGASVRWGHAKARTLWTEGTEPISAWESYDQAAEMMETRRQLVLQHLRAAQLARSCT